MIEPPTSAVTKVTQNLNNISKEQLVPTNIPQGALPTPEFIAQINRIEAAKKAILPIPPKLSYPTPIEKKKTEPLVLKYKWEGQCDKCGNNVETIEVTLDSYNMVVAFCSTDKRQILSQRVIPIDGQLKGGGQNDVPKREPIRKKVQKRTYSLDNRKT